MAAVPKQPLEIAQETALSATQERLWFLHELDPDKNLSENSILNRQDAKVAKKNGRNGGKFEPPRHREHRENREKKN